MCYLLGYENIVHKFQNKFSPFPEEIKNVSHEKKVWCFKWYRVYIFSFYFSYNLYSNPTLMNIMLRIILIFKILNFNQLKDLSSWKHNAKSSKQTCSANTFKAPTVSQ